MRFLIFAAGFILPSLLFAGNVIQPGVPVLDRPTLTALGVQLPITGDDNFNASVAVRYRKTGTSAWRSALPLFRVHPENTVGYTLQPQFAGSVFDLRPSTSYDIELHVTDPDGPVDQIFTLTAVTRAVPTDPATPRQVPVNSVATLTAALQAAQPGDIITLADGVYNVDTVYTLASGTAQNPIVIRGTSQNGTILDGGNCTSCNVIEIYGSYVHIERMTIQNSLRAIRFQTAAATGNVIRRVHIRDVVLAVGDRQNQTDFYICDNIVEGRLAWPNNYGADGGIHSSDDGLLVSGFGHVVCHNQISGFADALQINQQGSRAIDFYGNETLFTYDDGIELDSSEGNVRCFRNRFTNTFQTISLQPILGGPAYVFRNIGVNVIGEPMKFHALGIVPPQETNGILAYHNTFVSPQRALYMDTPNSPHHFRLYNNLFVGPSPMPGNTVEWGGPIDDGIFDYNGYFSDGPFVFKFPVTGYRVFPNFAAMQAGGMETHGALLTQPIFANGLTAPASYLPQLPPQDVTLAAASSARSRGLALPNVNDQLIGVTPDLGAVQTGCPNTIYGPRPLGVDESNQSFGCDLTISAATLAISPGAVYGGQPATGTVTLTPPAPAGATVALATSDPVTIPASVFVPPGASSGSFTVTTTPVSSAQTVTVTASYLGVNTPATLTVNPAALTGISAPSAIAGGQSATGTVTLTSAAGPGGIAVSLLSSNPAIAAVPATVTVPAGASSATFTIAAGTVSVSTPVTLTAGGIASVALSVNPAPPVLTGISATPALIGLVTLSAPTQTGAVVTLSSSNPLVATVPATVTIPPGASAATFTIRAGRVKTGSTTLKASYAGIDKTVIVTVDHKGR